MNIDSLRKDLQELNFTALDFETANEKRDSICAVGLVVVESGNIIEQKKILVRPAEIRFEKINMRIHNITADHIKDEPEFDIVWNEIKLFIENKIVLAHNADFDVDALNQTLIKYGLQIPYFKSVCTQKLAQDVFIDLLNYRLPDVANYLGLELSHHDCLSDAMIAAEIGIRGLPLVHFSNYDLINNELTHTIQKKSSAEKTKRNYFSGLEKKHLDKNLLIPHLQNADPNNFFYNKKVVFTGDMMSISRQDAALKIQALGADINTAISKRTDIVIVGKGAGPAKMKKIEDLKSQGVNILIIGEEDFLIAIDLPQDSKADRVTAAAVKLALRFSEESDIPPRLKVGYEEKTKPNLNSFIEQRFIENVALWKNCIETIIGRIEAEQAWRFIHLMPQIENALTSVTQCQDFIDLTELFVLRRDKENCSDEEVGLLAQLHSAFQNKIQSKIEETRLQLQP